MKKRLIGSLFSFVLAITVMGAASFSQEQQQHPQHQEPDKDWGFGDGINGAIVTAALMGVGWGIGKLSSMGFKSQESQLKTDILKEVRALIEEEIASNQEKADLVVGRQFDAIMTELMALGKEIKGIERKLDETKHSMEKRMLACEGEIRRIEGNVDNILPHVNQAIMNAFCPIGLTPVSVRKPSIKPESHSEEP